MQIASAATERAVQAVDAIREAREVTRIDSPAAWHAAEDLATRLGELLLHSWESELRPWHGQ